jgi:hypothetical protein
MTEITETPEELTVRQLIKGINEYAYDKLPPTKLKKVTSMFKSIRNSLPL